MPDDTAEGKTHATRALIELRRRILGGELPAAPGSTRPRSPARCRYRARRCARRLPASPRMACSTGPRAAMSSAPSSTPTSPTRSSCAACSRARGPARGRAWRRPGASRPHARDQRRLDACLDDGSDIDFDGYAAANSDFHLALATLAGSAPLARELERVCRLPFAAPSAFLPDKQ